MSSESEHKKNNDSESSMSMRRRIELHLRRSRMSPTRFGREVLDDPRFVFDLRRGREMREKTRARVRAWLDRQGAGR